MNAFDKKPNKPRRDFLCRMSLLSGAAVTTTMIPLPLLASSPAVQHWRGVSAATPYTYMDEALGNYPGYSEAIGFGRGHLVADAGLPYLDSQLTV